MKLLFLPGWILCLGENFKQFIVGQEEESWEIKTFLFQIFIETLKCYNSKVSTTQSYTVNTFEYVYKHAGLALDTINMQGSDRQGSKLLHFQLMGQKASFSQMSSPLGLSTQKCSRYAVGKANFVADFLREC